MEEKIRQHYVSRFYLDSWATQDSNGDSWIWVHNKKDKNTYKTANLKKVAQQNRFYRVEIDEVVWGMLSYYFAPLQGEPFVAEMLHKINQLRLVNAYRVSGLERHEKLAPLETNFLEDMYSALESEFAYTVAAMSARPENMNVAVEEDAERHHDNLLKLIASQYFRTRRARKAVIDLTKDMYLESVNGTEKLTPVQVETVTKVILFVESIRLANNLIRTGFTLSLDHNASDLDLVTSSNPVWGNVEDREEKEDVSSFKAVMPLAPKVNLRLFKSDNTDSVFQFNSIDRGVVYRQNKLIAEASDLDVYATTKQQLNMF
ncbi:DUF4238 domain-containing protein [Pseudomonas sp. P7548]|uniref:DUF4238 domain-containing protein n=1 Tax=Pseudomonas sp. P7548 TaxID=2726981 RepID=UPI0015B88A65|nr:DUF4238 domain-containing protein [Pseudomonas sp. P7548]NWE19827.1 DUF4238 domain-containing protein [Pseudomonas sp. P7548]